MSDLANFNHYAQKDTFEKELAENLIDDSSISFIKDTRLIYTHELFYGGSTVTKDGEVIGELIIVDSEDEPYALVTLENLNSLKEELEGLINNKSSLPEGGEVGQVLTKTEEGAEWSDISNKPENLLLDSENIDITLQESYILLSSNIEVKEGDTFSISLLRNNRATLQRISLELVNDLYISLSNEVITNVFGTFTILRSGTISFLRIWLDSEEAGILNPFRNIILIKGSTPSNEWYPNPLDYITKKWLLKDSSLGLILTRTEDGFEWTDGLTKSETDSLYQPKGDYLTSESGVAYKSELLNYLEKLPEGTTGQVLTKTDTGVEWKNATAGGDFSELIREINEKLTWRTLE